MAQVVVASMMNGQSILAAEIFRALTPDKCDKGDMFFIQGLFRAGFIHQNHDSPHLNAPSYQVEHDKSRVHVLFGAHHPN